MPASHPRHRSQWNLPPWLDGAAHRASVDGLARDTGVGRRAIWHDIRPLQDVGFPVTGEKREDARAYWMRLTAVNGPGLGVAGDLLATRGPALQPISGSAFAAERERLSATANERF